MASFSSILREYKIAKAISAWTRIWILRHNENKGANEETRLIQFITSEHFFLNYPPIFYVSFLNEWKKALFLKNPRTVAKLAAL